MSRLAGKVAICTGSGRVGGLGAAILGHLAQAGCRVVVTDLGAPEGKLDADHVGAQSEMEKVADELRAGGHEVLTHACDVRNPEAVAGLIAATVETFGRVDIMVNNAAVGYLMKPLLELSPDDWELVNDVNLKGAFLCTQLAAKQMVEQGDGGRIVNIASQAAKSGFRHMAPYVSSKHGMIGLTRSAAIDLAPHAITVNAVCPNHVTTGLGAKQNEYFAELRGVSVQEYRDGIRSRIPLGRVGLPSDTAAAVSWLASDEASYITGEALNVSGGEEMH